ncbi:hypothetical protein SAMN04489842_0893 [Natronobacterium texcoconense]|uniref:Uncharacterized protein n=1 Tax=Natronobacterium texcoconense TaxID=1095778 RepID=A0A1H1B1V6_NATTX|nr:hypothetical protein SAMN04489842_0893 [Natronobacterium texcoconense]
MSDDQPSSTGDDRLEEATDSEVADAIAAVDERTEDDD